jgi:hypothetical protein
VYSQIVGFSTIIGVGIGIGIGIDLFSPFLFDTDPDTDADTDARFQGLLIPLLCEKDAYQAKVIRGFFRSGIR